MYMYVCMYIWKCMCMCGACLCMWYVQVSLSYVCQYVCQKYPDNKIWMINIPDIAQSLFPFGPAFVGHNNEIPHKKGKGINIKNNNVPWTWQLIIKNTDDPHKYFDCYVNCYIDSFYSIRRCKRQIVVFKNTYYDKWIFSAHSFVNHPADLKVISFLWSGNTTAKHEIWTLDCEILRESTRVCLLRPRGLSENQQTPHFTMHGYLIIWFWFILFHHSSLFLAFL